MMKSRRDILLIGSTVNRKAGAFRRSALTVGILASFSIMYADVSLAADGARTNEELQAENARLRQEIEALKQANKPSAASTENPEVNSSLESTSTAISETKVLGAVRVRGRRVTPLEGLKETPKSVSVVTGEELEKFDTSNFRDIVTKIGNVGMTNSNPQTASLYIRGLGVTAKLNGLDPSVGVSIDGVSYATSAMVSSFSYVDLATVDVTRGPTGTLGGKNANVGQIDITTRAPSFNSEAAASITYGDHQSLVTRAAIGGPVIDDLLAWRGTFYREQSDGSIFNQDDKNYTYRNKDRTYGRVQLLLTPSDNFTARASFEITPHANEGSDNASTYPRPTPDYYDITDSTGKRILVDQRNESTGKLNREWFKQEKNYSVAGNYLNNEINILNQNYTVYSTKGGSLNLAWNVADYTLSSITGYRDYYFSSGGASDNPFDIVRPRTSGQVDNYQWSQEFRINSPTEGFIDYQAGLYFLKVEVPNRVNLARYGSDAGAYYATPAQYTGLYSDGTDSSGRNLLLNSLDRLSTKLHEEYSNRSEAIYGSINWHFSDPLTVATGLRITREIRHSSAYSLVTDQGFGAELNPVSKNNVFLGGFDSSAAGALGAGNTADQLALANLVAQKYFGVSTYNALSISQKQQVAYAKSIRNARLGTLFQETDAEGYDAVLPTFNISPSYKLDEKQMAYVSWQHGEKAGVSQIIGATSSGGKSVPNKKEKSDAFELGLKSLLLDNTLVVNADVYVNNITDYIQPMYFEDKAQTIANGNGNIAYTSGLGNVPKVQAKGFELDAIFSGIPYTTLRFAGAYNDARYKDFKFLAKPSELGGDTTAAAYYDATGKTLVNAPKFAGNLFAEYARPVFDTLVFHTDLSYKYTSSFNSDPSLSRYAVVDGYGLTDFAIGLGRKDKLFDVNLIVKNLFNTDTSYTPSWNTYYPTDERWVGLNVSSSI